MSFRILFPFILAVLSSYRLHAQPPAAPVFWLRADTGIVRSLDTVKQWHDLRNPGRYASSAPSAPIYVAKASHGLPAVGFNGVNQYMTCSSVFPVNSDYTKIVVLRVNNFGAVNNVLSGSTGHALYLASSPYPKLFQRGNFVDSYVPISSGYTILTGLFDDAALRGRIYVNGRFGGAGYAIERNADSTLNVGAFAGGYTFSGEISEVIVYDRELSDADRESAEHYLAVKYGIERYSSTSEFPFTSFPAPLQFYPRDERDSAEIPIAGVVHGAGFDSVRVEVYRDGGYWKSVAQTLEYEGDEASFALAPTIHARAVEYGVRAYLVSEQGDSLIGRRDSIICGDVLLIAGQSNSTPSDPAVTYSSEFCRTFGVQSGYARYEPSDTLWGLSNGFAGQSYQGRFLVGVWGLKAQQLLLERHGIPTCVILGGVSGSSIEINQRNDADPEDPGTIYGRMLFRARKSGVAAAARALIWYQGESNTITNYDANFKALYEDWRRDYPALEQIYVVQIRPGCAVTNPHLELRELQRTLPDSLPDITAVSATGLPGHDGCHYLYEGYNALGMRIYRMLARDLYGVDDTIDVNAPNLRRAYYSSPDRDELTLVFDPPSTTMIWPSDTLVGGTMRRMIDYFYLDGIAGMVREGFAAGNTVRLKLTGPSQATSLTYIPDHFYNDTALIYEGPWVTNRRGVGALTFHGVPIYSASTGVDNAKPDVGGTLLSIAPNPASRELTARFAIPRAGRVRMELYDTGGRLVLLEEEVFEAGAGELRLDVGSTPSGAYRCMIRCNGFAAGRIVTVVR